MPISRRRVVLACLIGLGGALAVVGVVSGTLLRHVIQILPIGLAAAVSLRSPEWGAYASIPIFFFWIGIVGLIWLFLLGLSRLATGHYTPIEVVCTFMMAAFSVVGVVAAMSLGKPVRASARVLAVMLFASLQLAAMWVSFLKPIANR
jgi:hypothetical protein